MKSRMKSKPVKPTEPAAKQKAKPEAKPVEPDLPEATEAAPLLPLHGIAMFDMS